MQTISHCLKFAQTRLCYVQILGKVINLPTDDVGERRENKAERLIHKPDLHL